MKNKDFIFIKSVYKQKRYNDIKKDISVDYA